jgi:hypothetical protein
VWLISASRIDAELGPYLHHELRAFPDDPTPDPFLAARGDRIKWEELPLISPNAGYPSPVNKQNENVVVAATTHIKTLLGWAEMVVGQVTRKPSDQLGLTEIDFGEYAAKAWESLGVELRRSDFLTPISDHLHLIREDNYKIGNVITPSVHESIRELARLVWLCFSSGVWRCRSPEAQESDRWAHGPWQAHEVVPALTWFRENPPELFSVFNTANLQIIEADLKRESARLKLLEFPKPTNAIVDVEPIKTIKLNPKKTKLNKPTIPDKYKISVKLFREYREKCKEEKKKVTHKNFFDWAQQNHHALIPIGFDKWWNNTFSRQERRASQGN